MAQSCAACVFRQGTAHRAWGRRRFDPWFRRRLREWAERNLGFQRERVGARPFVLVVALDEEPGILALGIAPWKSA